MKTIYNNVVNFDKESNEVTILEETFEHESGSKEATGTSYSIISKQEYQERIHEYLYNPQAVSEYWEDSVGTFLSYDSMVGIANDEEEIARLVIGLDYDEEHLQLIREELNLSEEDCFVITLSSCGRIFDSTFEGNINSELNEIIKSFEK